MVDVAFEKKRGDNMSAGGLAKRLLPLLVSIGTIFTLRSTTDSLSDVIVNDLGRSTQTSNFAPRDLGQSIRVSVTADAADDDFDAEPFGGIDESSSGDSEYVGGEDDIFSDYSKETEVAEKTSSLSEADDDNELADAEKQKTENEEELDNTKKVIEDEEKTEEEQSDVVDALEIDEQKEDADTKVKSEEDKSEEFMSKESNEIKAAKALIANNQHKEAFTPKEGDRFEPGSLPIPRSESIAQCYLKPKLKYFMAKSCAYSPDYKVILTMSGKTGSSTQRYVMNKVWNGTYTSCQELEKNGVEPGTAWVVATREPLDHFLSGYKEMLLRAKLWEEPMDYAYGHVPEEYNKFLDLVKHLDVKERASLKKSDKPEDLKLKSQMLETFIRDFDGKVFDEHLSMQAIQLRFNGKKMMNFNFTLESQHLSEELADLAKTVGAPIPPPVQKRSHAGEPLGEDLASDETIQKICQLRASDYCCLNYELPDICKKAGLSEKVECEWVKNPHNRRELSIKAVNMLDPDELSSRPDSDEANSDTAIESKQKEDENSEGKEGSKETSEKITPKLGDVFEPGSLPVSRNETIAQCKSRLR